MSSQPRTPGPKSRSFDDKAVFSERDSLLVDLLNDTFPIEVDLEAALAEIRGRSLIVCRRAEN